MFTAPADPAAVLVHDHLTLAAARVPDHPAVLTPAEPAPNGPGSPADDPAGDAPAAGTGRDLHRVHTFAAVDRDAGCLAAALQEIGVSRGDRVVIVAESSVEQVVALWATLRAGGVFVVVNPTTKADKLAFILRDCTARAVVAQRRIASVVLPAVADSPSVRCVLWAGGPPTDPGHDRAHPGDRGGDHRVDHRDLAAELRRPVAAPVDPGLIDADLAGLVYTSGSTGFPKGVMLTHRNIVHNTWSIATYLGLRSDDVITCLLPLSFDYGLFQVFMAARVGCTVALERSFAYPRDVLERLAATGTTVLPGVPTLFAGLLRHAPFDDVDLSRLRLLTNTAAALPPAHIRRLTTALPRATLFSMYGLTECTRVSYLPPTRLADKPGSVGRAMPNTEAYVVDSQGRRVASGVEGELVVRGASVMRGYWNRPDETAACLRDGEVPGEKVLHTGDRFVADDEGFLYFVGRGDDVFKCKGEKVSPKEVEQVLYELDDVVEAAVVGTPHELDGTAVRAVVVPAPGSDLTEARIRAHCRARLEGHLVPRYVELRDALPRTDSGKLHKAALTPTGS